MTPNRSFRDLIRLIETASEGEALDIAPFQEISYREGCEASKEMGVKHPDFVNTGHNIYGDEDESIPPMTKRTFLLKVAGKNKILACLVTNNMLVWYTNEPQYQRYVQYVENLADELDADLISTPEGMPSGKSTRH